MSHTPIDRWLRAPDAFGHAGRYVPVGLVLLMLLVALRMGVSTTRGLDWPGTDWGGVGIDLYRDISSAQTMVDDGYGPDPTYAGESMWYNPLTPGVSAITTRLTGLPVSVVVTRIGAYANLLAPITFCAMTAMLFGRWVALFSTAGFLFLLSGHLPSYVSATYSPWFLPVNFVQSFFYLTMMALTAATRTGRMRYYVLTGVCWGVTFLGHTAPALVMGGMVSMWAFAVVRRRGVEGEPALTPRQVMTAGLLMAGMAIVVSAPFLRIIVGVYGLDIKNPEPTAYTDELLSRGIFTLLRAHVTVAMAVAIVGFVSVVRHSRGVAERLLLRWTVVAYGLVVYGLLQVGARLLDYTLPAIVPSFHFFFYLKAASAIFFGLGVVVVGQAIASRWLAGGRRDASRSAIVAAAFTCAVLLALGATTYASRPDFGAAREDALIASRGDRPVVSTWFRSHATPRDVVLAPDREAATAVVTSGVKTVAIFGGFSNPYVDLDARRSAREAMLTAIGHGADAFGQAAGRMGVTYVLAPVNDPAYAKAGAFLETVLETRTLRVYRVGAPTSTP